MQSNGNPHLPNVPDLQDPRLRDYLMQLTLAIKSMAAKVNADMVKGNQRHEFLSGMPSWSSLDEGVIRFVKSGANRYLVTRLSTSVKLSILSSLP